eukprot:4707635-Prymnesium_polylepis.2
MSKSSNGPLFSSTAAVGAKSTGAGAGVSAGAGSSCMRIGLCSAQRRWHQSYRPRSPGQTEAESAVGYLRAVNAPRAAAGLSAA